MTVLLIIGRGLKRLQSLSYCDICEQWKRSHLERARIDSEILQVSHQGSSRVGTHRNIQVLHVRNTKSGDWQGTVHVNVLSFLQSAPSARHSGAIRKVNLADTRYRRSSLRIERFAQNVRVVNVIVIVYRQVLSKDCARGMLNTVSWHSGTALARNGVEVFMHPPSICA